MTLFGTSDAVDFDPVRRPRQADAAAPRADAAPLPEKRP
jgi:hypothetical protein